MTIVLFGHGGTLPAKFTFRRQCVSPDILNELLEFFHRESVLRTSLCRSIMKNGKETPVRYWKDNIKELVNQYMCQTYIHLQPSSYQFPLLHHPGRTLPSVQRVWKIFEKVHVFPYKCRKSDNSFC